MRVDSCASDIALRSSQPQVNRTSTHITHTLLRGARVGRKLVFVCVVAQLKNQCANFAKLSTRALLRENYFISRLSCSCAINSTFNQIVRRKLAASSTSSPFHCPPFHARTNTRIQIPFPSSRISIALQCARNAKQRTTNARYAFANDATRRRHAAIGALRVRTSGKSEHRQRRRRLLMGIRIEHYIML